MANQIELQENAFEYKIVVDPAKFPFRLADCQSYKTISGRGFKEVDLAWFNPNSDVLYMMELKAWENNNPKVGNIYYQVPTSIEDFCNNNFAKKIFDVLYLLTQKKPLVEIRPCVDKSILNSLDTHNDKVLIVLLIKFPNLNKSLRTAIKSFVASKLKAYFFEANLDFSIDQNKIFVFEHDDFYSNRASVFGLKVVPISQQI